MITKRCRKCDVVKYEADYSKDKENKDGLKRYCKACCKALDRSYIERNREKHNEKSLRWQKANPRYEKERWVRYRKNNRVKIRARQKLRYHVSVGNIVRGNCVVCGTSKVEAHHHDYSKPLDVIWLCHLHHARVEHGLIVL